MFLRIENLQEKKLIGNCVRMSFADNKTRMLWQRFMPRRMEITNNVGLELYSAEVYESGFFNNFDPTSEFEKWAAVEVTDFNSIPDRMESLVFPAGMYAVFIHRGPASEGVKTYQYIFQTWLPNSDFTVDTRPHFAVMGKNYKYEDQTSEEEIWIPIRAKENS